MYALGRPDPKLAESVNLSVEVFADARADLVFNMGAAYTRVAPGRVSVIERSNLDAQRVHPITIKQRGEVIVAGARFRTAGLAVFVPSVHPWTNRVVPIAQAFGKDALALERALRESIGDTAKQGALLDEFFVSCLDVTDSKRDLWALTKIEAAAGLVRVDELAAEAGISIRHVDRLFRQHLGVTPKTFARIARFQNAITALKSDPAARSPRSPRAAATTTKRTSCTIAAVSRARRRKKSAAITRPTRRPTSARTSSSFYKIRGANSATLPACRPTRRRNSFRARQKSRSTSERSPRTSGPSS